MNTPKDKIISIQTLLKGRNDDFDNTPSSAIKMVRHADKRVGNKKDSSLKIEGKPLPGNVANLYELYIYHRDLFHKYMTEQEKGKFDGIKYMVVFLGDKGTTARFLGVYEVKDRRLSPVNEKEEILDLKYMPDFAILEEKVIVDWGKNTQAWHQYFYNEKYVRTIEQGISKSDGTPAFKDYLEVMLNHHELGQVLNDKEWEQKLKAVNCIYLIVDKSNGRNYVGSTSGRECIFGRWSQYAATGHGNNVKLAELIKNDPQYHIKNFQWSILEVLPSNVTEYEAVDRESLWKRKLLSREWGYNKN